jgi:hypothetical protein
LFNNKQIDLQHKDAFDKDEEVRNNQFKFNMKEFLEKEKLENVNEFDLVFIPMAKSHHFYLLCFNLKVPKTVLIDNSASEEYEAKYLGLPEIMVSKLNIYNCSLLHS